MKFRTNPDKFLMFKAQTLERLKLSHEKSFHKIFNTSLDVVVIFISIKYSCINKQCFWFRCTFILCFVKWKYFHIV